MSSKKEDVLKWGVVMHCIIHIHVRRCMLPNLSAPTQGYTLTCSIYGFVVVKIKDRVMTRASLGEVCKRKLVKEERQGPQM